MSASPSHLADAFAALAAEVRAQGQGDSPLHAVLLRLLCLLGSMIRHWQSASPARSGGHVLLAASYPRAVARCRVLTSRTRADLRDMTRPYQALVPAGGFARVLSVAHSAPLASAHSSQHNTARQAMPPGANTALPRPSIFSEPAWAAAPTHALLVTT